MTRREKSPDEEPKIIPFPKDDRWLLCGCRKCEARREEAKRVG